MAEQHAVLTGPIRGTVTLKDGTVVDVKPAIVYVDTLEQAHEVAHLVAKRYVKEGHPDHEYGENFTHDEAQSRKNFAALKGEDN